MKCYGFHQKSKGKLSIMKLESNHSLGELKQLIGLDKIWKRFSDYIDI